MHMAFAVRIWTLHSRLLTTGRKSLTILVHVVFINGLSYNIIKVLEKAVGLLIRHPAVFCKVILADSAS